MISSFNVMYKHRVNLLFLLRSKGEISSADLSIVGDYGKMMLAARQLESVGLIYSNTNHKRKNKVTWGLTAEGVDMANYLDGVDKKMTATFERQKVL